MDDQDRLRNTGDTPGNPDNSGRRAPGDSDGPTGEQTPPNAKVPFKPKTVSLSDGLPKHDNPPLTGNRAKAFDDPPPEPGAPKT